MTPAIDTSRGFLDILPDMCFVLSRELTIIDCNKRAREVTGLPAPLDGTIPFYSLLTSDTPLPPLHMLPVNGRRTEAEAKLQTRSRGSIDVVLYIRRTREADRDLFYIVGRDVSEAKRKELDLLRFSNVVHFTVNPIQITDAQGRMVYVNPAFEKATGYPKEELIGGDPNVISSRKYTKEFWVKVWNTISAGKVWTGEIENRRKDGRPLFTQLLISPILNNDGVVVGYLGSHRDVTEQRALEQQLMHSQKMESIGTLAAGIAHEVGNPLASISSVVQVLMRTVDDQFARDKLGLVQSQVHRITKIIRDLVDFSRPSNYEVRTDRRREGADRRGGDREDGKEGEADHVRHARAAADPPAQPGARPDLAGVHQHPPECGRRAAGEGRERSRRTSRGTTQQCGSASPTTAAASRGTPAQGL